MVKCEFGHRFSTLSTMSSRTKRKSKSAPKSAKRTRSEEAVLQLQSDAYAASSRAEDGTVSSHSSGVTDLRQVIRVIRNLPPSALLTNIILMSSGVCPTYQLEDDTCVNTGIPLERELSLFTREFDRRFERLERQSKEK